MNKKILLKALMPLAIIGIDLGIALPLVSCSCNNNDEDVPPSCFEQSTPTTFVAQVASTANFDTYRFCFNTSVTPPSLFDDNNFQDPQSNFVFFIEGDPTNQHIAFIKNSAFVYIYNNDYGSPQWATVESLNQLDFLTAKQIRDWLIVTVNIDNLVITHFNWLGNVYVNNVDNWHIASPR